MYVWNENIKNLWPIQARWNSKIYNLYRALNVKIGRLGWVWSYYKKGKWKIPEKVLNGKVHNARPVGKPRTRWEDVVLKDTSKLLGIGGLGQQKTEKSGGIFWGRPGPRRGCSAMNGVECRKCTIHTDSIKNLWVFWIVKFLSSFINLFHIPLILYRCGTSHVYI